MSDILLQIIDLLFHNFYLEFFDCYTSQKV